MLSLVVPIYKSEANLPPLFRELEEFADRLPDTLEVVFVVDGSPDASLDILQSHLATWTLNAQLVELSRNFGSFAAIAAGLREANGEYLAVAAADLQEPLDLIAARDQAIDHRSTVARPTKGADSSKPKGPTSGRSGRRSRWP